MTYLYPRITHAAIIALALLVAALSIGHADLRGDLNNDGTADALDALMILQESAGLIQTAVVTRVIDGDTIEVNLNGRLERVRYYSIDAPEPHEPGGPAAQAYNEYLTRDGVLLYPAPDGRDRDTFGRLLRNVYTPAGLWIEASLVAGGHATWR